MSDAGIRQFSRSAARSSRLIKLSRLLLLFGSGRIEEFEEVDAIILPEFRKMHLKLRLGDVPFLRLSLCHSPTMFVNIRGNFVVDFSEDGQKCLDLWVDAEA